MRRFFFCLVYFKEKLLVSNTCWVFRKTSKIYTIGVYFLSKNKRFHHINWISALKSQNAKGIFTLQFNFQCWIPKNQCWNTLYPILSEALGPANHCTIMAIFVSPLLKMTSIQHCSFLSIQYVNLQLYVWMKIYRILQEFRICLIQYFDADFLWKVSFKILNNAVSKNWIINTE